MSWTAREVVYHTTRSSSIDQSATKAGFQPCCAGIKLASCSRWRSRLKLKRVSLRNVNFLRRSGGRCSVRAWWTIAWTEPRRSRYLVLLASLTRRNTESTKNHRKLDRRPANYRELTRTCRMRIITESSNHSMNFTTAVPTLKRRSLLLFLRCNIRTLYHQFGIKAVGAA